MKSQITDLSPASVNENTNSGENLAMQQPEMIGKKLTIHTDLCTPSGKPFTTWMHCGPVVDATQNRGNTTSRKWGVSIAHLQRPIYFRSRNIPLQKRRARHKHDRIEAADSLCSKEPCTK